MDDQNKPRNPNDLLIVHNIDSEPHEWQYDAVRTPLPYYIGAGETRKLPYYIAKHGVEKLIDKILLRQNKIHTNPIFRNELREKIVLGLEHINIVREKTANEIMLEDLQRKKDSDPYEELLKKRDIEAERARTAELARMQPAAPLVQTVGVVTPVQAAPVVATPPSPLDDAMPPATLTPPLPTPDTVGVPPVTVPETIVPGNDPLASALNNIDAPAPIDPERQKVYDFATTTMHLDLSHEPTKEKFDATSVEQLKQDLGYMEAPTA